VPGAINSASLDRDTHGVNGCQARTRSSCQKLTIVRNKLIAHHELQHDPVSNSFSEIKLPSIGETYDELQKAIVVISRSLTRLAFLLMDADITLKVFERVINEDVAKFWDLSPATRRN
jgi:hypothetical protein